jgi:hypothetical protein
MLKIFERNDIRSHFKALGEAKVASIIIDVPLRSECKLNLSKQNDK